MDETRFGDYRLLDLVGEGGMGQVYRAFDTSTNRTVALKVLPEHLANDAGFRQRFLREAQIAASLTDPHVVPIHRFGEIDDRLYVDMRLIEGQDLHSILASSGPMRPERAVAIIEQVAGALHSAHSAGLVHRDVKPSNVLVTANDFAYLIDFGIARGSDHTSLTSVGTTIGTLAYMAPERFETATADARSDVYALACVFYECLTGKQAFPGTTFEQQIAAHLFGAPPRPSAAAPAVSPAFDDVIAHGLARNPDTRYRTTLDLARAARHALTSGQFASAPTATSHGQRAMSAAPTQFVQDAAPPRYVQPPPPRAGGGRRVVGIATAVVAVIAVAATAIGLTVGSGDSTTNDSRATTTASRTKSGTPSSSSREPLDVPLPPNVAQTRQLTVGVNVPYAPAEFKDSSGELVGFDIDLMKAIGDVLGLTVEFSEMDFAKIIPAVQGGTVDVGASAFTDTREREQIVDFVTYYSAGTMWGRRTGTSITPDSACGTTVAVQATTYQDTDELPARSQACTAAGRPAINIVGFDSQDQASNAVTVGQADAFSADSPVTAYAIKRSDGRLEMAGSMFDAAPYGWAIAKGSVLGEALKQALQRLIDSGEYTRILSDWGVEVGAITAPVINGAVS